MDKPEIFERVNPPGDITGHTLNSTSNHETTELAVARARLQEASIMLLERHNRPDDLRLAFTPNGATEPSTATMDPYEYRWDIERRYLGSDPAVHARNFDWAKDTYTFGINAVRDLPRGGILVDAVSFELILPSAKLRTGAIAIHGMARYFTDPPPSGRRPNISQSASLSHVAKNLRSLMGRTNNPAGDAWEWRATSIQS